MPVAKTASPKVSPTAPKDSPRKVRPSSSSSTAGVVRLIDVLHSDSPSRSAQNPTSRSAQNSSSRPTQEPLHDMHDLGIARGPATEAGLAWLAVPVPADDDQSRSGDDLVGQPGTYADRPQRFAGQPDAGDVHARGGDGQLSRRLTPQPATGDPVLPAARTDAADVDALHGRHHRLG